MSSQTSLASLATHLLLVFLVGRRQALLEGDGDSGDLMIVRTALEAGKDGFVDGALHVVENVLTGFRVHGSDACKKQEQSGQRCVLECRLESGQTNRQLKGCTN